MASPPNTQVSPASSPIRSGEDGFDIRRVQPILGGGGSQPFGWPSDDLAFLAEVLRVQHTPQPLIERLIAAAASPERQEPAARLAHAIGIHFRFLSIDDALRLPALLVIGPPAAGKTMLVAKLAAKLEPRRVLAVSAAAADAPGTRQLEEYMQVLGVSLAQIDDAEQLKSAVAGARRRTVLIDTPAASPADAAATERLRALKEAAGAEAVLALPADLATEEAADLAHWAAGIGAKLLIATRLDLVRRIGGVLAAADAGPLALVGASVAPHFAYGLKALSGELIARRVLTGALDAERWRLR
ncbi:MAG TPA: hypothetical protein VFC38_11705 [Stellaceae bacterium]|nr:hypothetical protein [Stellaceae bacterium]